MLPTARVAATAATLAPLIFVGVDLADAFSRPAYDPARHWVSHLSLGDRGWLGAAKLVTCAVLLVLAAVGLRRAGGLRRAAGLRRAGRLRRAATRGTRASWSWRTVAVAGLALLAAAALPMDPSLGYPTGASVGQSWHGTGHDLAAAVLVGAMAVAGWLLGRDLRRAGHSPAWQSTGRAATAVVVIGFVVCSVLVGLDFAGTLPGAPSGLFERIALYTGMAWLGLATRQALGPE